MTNQREAYLIDTNVISEFSAGNPHHSVFSWFKQHQTETMYLSVVTIGELEKGIARLPKSKRKTALDQWLNQKLMVQFDGYILNTDVDTFRLWGRLSAERAKAGNKMQVGDALIAALAKQHHLTLVTRNISDFEGAGIDLLNPWEI